MFPHLNPLARSVPLALRWLRRVRPAPSALGFGRDIAR